MIKDGQIDIKKKILESRIKSLEFLFSVIQSNNFSVNHLISASAIGCYPSSESKEFNENESIKADNFLSKVVNDWELAANKFNSIGIPVSIVRIGLVVSAKGGFFRKTVESMFYTKIAVIFGDGKQFQSWIHIEDVSAIFLFISKNKLLGNFNAVAPNPITNLEMVNTTKNQLYNVLLNKNFETFTGKWFNCDYTGFKKKLLVYFSVKVPRKFLNLFLEKCIRFYSTVKKYPQKKFKIRVIISSIPALIMQLLT